MRLLRRLRRDVLCLFVACQVCSVLSQMAKVAGVSGDDVVLPCSYKYELPANASVFWLDPDDRIVQKFQLEEKQKRNFSTVLKNVQASHSGVYICSIPSVSYRTQIQLNVSGSRPVGRGGSSEIAAPLQLLLYLLLLLLLL